MEGIGSAITKDLITLAIEINAWHAQAEAAIGRALEYALNAGQLLIQAKAQVQHGEWLPWLTTNFRGSDRTAQIYMRIARQWPEIAASKSAGSAHLSIDGAVRMLAAPSAEVTDDAPNAIPAEWVEAIAISDRLTDALQIVGLTYPEPGGTVTGFDRLGDDFGDAIEISNSGKTNPKGEPCFHVAFLRTTDGGGGTVTFTVKPMPWWLIVHWTIQSCGAFDWRGATWVRSPEPVFWQAGRVGNARERLGAVRST